LLSSSASNDKKMARDSKKQQKMESDAILMEFFSSSSSSYIMAIIELAWRYFDQQFILDSILLAFLRNFLIKMPVFRQIMQNIDSST
jgi:hypothetical protein